MKRKRKKVKNEDCMKCVIGLIREMGVCWSVRGFVVLLGRQDQLWSWKSNWTINLRGYNYIVAIENTCTFVHCHCCCHVVTCPRRKCLIHKMGTR